MENVITSFDEWIQEVKRLYYDMGLRGDYLKSLTNNSNDDKDRYGLTPLEWFYWIKKQTPQEHVDQMTSEKYSDKNDWFNK